MKILVVHPSVELYGADKILLYALDLLAEKHDVTLLLPKNGILVSRVRETIPSISIRIEGTLPILHSKLKFFEMLQLPRKLFRINKIFKKHAFDLVYCNTLATSFILYTRWSKKKLIHVHEILGNPFLNLCFSTLIFLGAKKVICVSNHVKNHLFFSSNYSVLYNGIPDVAKNIQQQKNERVKFVLPGRIMPQKGQWFLLDTITYLPKTLLEKVEFHLFGSPPPMKLELLDTLTTRIQQLGLADSVHVHHFTANIQEIYLDADVLLVPSIMADSFPTTVLEAMMFSKPVITTNNGGASEIVRDEFGILIAPGNTIDFANSLTFFIQNKTLAFQMGQKAREEFETHFTISVFRKKFLSILTQYLES